MAIEDRWEVVLCAGYFKSSCLVELLSLHFLSNIVFSSPPFAAEGQRYRRGKENRGYSADLPPDGYDSHHRRGADAVFEWILLQFWLLISCCLMLLAAAFLKMGISRGRVSPAKWSAVRLAGVRIGGWADAEAHCARAGSCLNVWFLAVSLGQIFVEELMLEAGRQI